jgi:hypothetical protein
MTKTWNLIAIASALLALVLMVIGRKGSLCPVLLCAVAVWASKGLRR